MSLPTFWIYIFILAKLRICIASCDHLYLEFSDFLVFSCFICIYVDELDVDVYMYILHIKHIIKLVIMVISQLLGIISIPIRKSDEKQKFYQIFRLFWIIFMLNGEFEYQIDYLSQ